MYYTYIIYSAKLDRYYRGSTDNRAERLIDHNSGISKFTSKVSDWTLVYSEEYTTREEASFREREIKRKKVVIILNGSSPANQRLARALACSASLRRRGHRFAP